MLLDQHITGLCLLKIPKALRPGTYLIFRITRKHFIDGMNYAFSPLAMLLMFHPIHLHRLH